MPMQVRRPGAAREKRNSWSRGRGSYSYRGELKRGVKLNKKRLNRSVRRENGMAFKHADYKKIYRTIKVVDFS